MSPLYIIIIIIIITTTTITSSFNAEGCLLINSGLSR
jgi:hypothetical protein